MRLIQSILRTTGILTAMTLLAGLSGPACAKPAAASALNNKERAAVQPAGENGTAQSALVRSVAGGLKIPMYFEANRGQTDPSVKFFTRAAGYKLYLTATEAVTVLPRAEAEKEKGSLVVRMKLKGANANPQVQGLEILPGRTSYFLGNDSSKWQVGVEQYAKVKFGQVYPGIDMVYRFDKGNVEYDFVVAPGANPGRILIGFEGSKGLRLDPRGNLVLSVDGGELTYQAPKLYQMVDSRRVSVKGRFVLAGNKNARFEIGNYNKSRELVIDPAIMYGTFLGGSVEDKITSIQVDGARQAYVTGYSMSEPGGISGFPATTPAAQTYPLPIGFNNGAGGTKDVFVAKLSEDGSKLLWLAWLGGSLDDQANGIALRKMAADAVGEPQVFITGETKSDNVSIASAFPVYGPAMQACYPNTGSLAFVAQLTQPGNIPNLVYSTCWGGVSGTLINTGNAIAVDATGAAYVTGTTEVSGFPVVGGAAAPYATLGGAQDGFVMKINPAGTGGVAYSMFLGPTSGTTYSNAIAVDALGQAWVAGKTTSDTWPAAAMSGHFSATRTAGVNPDVFVAQVNAAGTALLYATYVNGNVSEEATAIALNKNGATGYNVFVAGWTNSGTDFPSTAYLLLPVGTGPGERPVPYQQTLKGADDAFVFRLDPAASGVQEMVFATHVGSDDGNDRAYGLALDSRDDAYISGWTEGAAGWHTTDTDPPLDPLTVGTAGLNVTGSVLTNTSGVGVKDAFVAAVSYDGLTRPFFTFLGSADATPVPQAATGIAIDALHNIYAAGYTGAANFPTTTASLEDGTAGFGINRNAGAGALDGWVIKVAPVVSFGAPLVASSPTITIAQPLDASIFNYTSTTAYINYSDIEGPGISTPTLVVKLDGVILSTTTSTVVFSSGTAGVVTVYASSATFDITLLSQSSHTINAYIADTAGNLASSTNTFIVDLASPTIAVAQPANGSFLNYTSTLAVVSYSDSGGVGLSTQTLVIKLDSVALSTSSFTRYASSATVLLTGLSQAAHTLDASIMDVAGNLTNAVQSGFTVDLTSAATVIAQPANGSYLNYTSTMAIVTYTDTGGSGFNLGSLIIKLDGTPVSAGSVTAYASSGTAQLTGLLQGAHTLDASIMDNAGNLNNAVQTIFTVDLSTPTIAIAQPANGSFLNNTSTTALVNYADTGGSGLNLARLTVTLDGYAAAASAGASQATVSLAALGAGVHTLNASIYDNAGNMAAASQVTFTVYASAPCGEDFFFPSPATGSTANFAYCMAGSGTVRIRVYNVIGDLVAKLADEKPAGPQFSQLNTGRLASGVYLYRLEKDYGGGNSTTSRVKKFVVKH